MHTLTRSSHAHPHPFNPKAYHLLTSGVPNFTRRIAKSTTPSMESLYSFFTAGIVSKLAGIRLCEVLNLFIGKNCSIWKVRIDPGMCIFKLVEGFNSIHRGLDLTKTAVLGMYVDSIMIKGKPARHEPRVEQLFRC